MVGDCRSKNSGLVIFFSKFMDPTVLSFECLSLNGPENNILFSERQCFDAVAHSLIALKIPD